MTRTFGSVAATAAAALLSLTARPAAAEDVTVTVLAILACQKSRVIEPKIAEIAQEMRKREPKFTGFALERTTIKKLKPGESAKFPLVGELELQLKIEAEKDDEGRNRITIKAPTLPEFSYACKCNRYFPFATEHKTAKGEVLLVAVMTKPCQRKP